MPRQEPSSPFFRLSGTAERIRRNIVFASALAFIFHAFGLQVGSVNSNGIGVDGLDTDKLLMIVGIIIAYELVVFLVYFIDEFMQWRQTFSIERSQLIMVGSSTAPSQEEYVTIIELMLRKAADPCELEHLIKSFSRFWTMHKAVHFLRVLLVDGLLPVSLAVYVILSCCF